MSRNHTVLFKTPCVITVGFKMNVLQNTNLGRESPVGLP